MPRAKNRTRRNKRGRNPRQKKQVSKKEGSAIQQEENKNGEKIFLRIPNYPFLGIFLFWSDTHVIKFYTNSVPAFFFSFFLFFCFLFLVSESPERLSAFPSEGKMSPSLLLLSFFLFCVCDVVLCNEEGRPKLVKGTLSEGRKNFLGGEYEWIQSAFEFDQPLYLNEPIICADLEQSCPPLDCVPCDWTTPEKATSCWDEQCCTPSVPIQEKERWCPNSTTTNPPPPFTAIKVNEKSEIFKMDAQEERSFRVFIGEDLYCHPILLAMRSLYGNHNLFISSIVPTPNFGDIFVVPGTYYRQNLFSYGQSNTVLCPGTRGYTPGTYSLLVTAYEATEFYFEIVSAPDPLPQPPPPEVVSCDSVPPEVLVTPEGDQAICLEDGKTVTIDTQVCFLEKNFFFYSSQKLKKRSFFFWWVVFKHTSK